MRWWRRLLCRLGRHPEFRLVARLSPSVARVSCQCCGREFAVYPDMQMMLPYVRVAELYERRLPRFDLL
jgi:hypothetical protein